MYKQYTTIHKNSVAISIIINTFLYVLISRRHKLILLIELFTIYVKTKLNYNNIIIHK